MRWVAVSWLVAGWAAAVMMWELELGQVAVGNRVAVGWVFEDCGEVGWAVVIGMVSGWVVMVWEVFGSVAVGFLVG